MFLPFFQTLREEAVPVSLREFLSFLEAMAAGLVIYDAEGFYHLARLTLVKDERHIDRFDRAFARAFSGLDGVTPDQVLETLDLPRDWLEKLAERHLISITNKSCYFHLCRVPVLKTRSSKRNYKTLPV